LHFSLFLQKKENKRKQILNSACSRFSFPPAGAIIALLSCKNGMTVTLQCCLELNLAQISHSGNEQDTYAGT
jgi:hypothetical protein